MDLARAGKDWGDLRSSVKGLGQPHARAGRDWGASRETIARAREKVRWQCSLAGRIGVRCAAGRVRGQPAAAEGILYEIVNFSRVQHHQGAYMASTRTIFSVSPDESIAF